jgi:hypothetical protein
MAVLGFELRLLCYNIYLRICPRKDDVEYLEDDVKVNK